MNLSAPIKKSLYPLVIALSSLIPMKSSLHAECMWKIEAGPAYGHIDVIHKKHTIKELDIIAARGEASLIFGRGWCVKPNIMYGKTEDRKSDFITTSLGFGRCIPICEQIIITPQGGLTYTYLETDVHIDHELYGRVKVHHKTKSLAPYIGTEVIFKIAKDWRFCVSAQYAWSNDIDKCKDFLHFKNDSQGPNYGAMLEYDITCDWSVNLGAAYNQSLSKEKHGLRGVGGKLGIARWF